MLLEEALVLTEFGDRIFIDTALTDGDLHPVLRVRSLRREQSKTKAQRELVSAFHVHPPVGWLRPPSGAILPQVARKITRLFRALYRQSWT